MWALLTIKALMVTSPPLVLDLAAGGAGGLTPPAPVALRAAVIQGGESRCAERREQEAVGVGVGGHREGNHRRVSLLGIGALAARVQRGGQAVLAGATTALVVLAGAG